MLYGVVGENVVSAEISKWPGSIFAQNHQNLKGYTLAFCQKLAKITFSTIVP